MSVGAIVGPGMIPISVGNVTPNPGGSTKVKFTINPPEVQEPTLFLVTLCIKIQIGSAVYSIYFATTVEVNPGTNPPIVFNVLLPNGTIILDVSAIFDVLYPELLS